MPKSSMIRARIEPKLKHEVESIFEKLGLNTTDAITLFYRQVIHFKGLPFEVRIPNNETRAAVEEANEGIGLKKFKTVNDLFKELDD